MADERAGGGRWQADARLVVVLVVAFFWLWRQVDPSRTYDGAGLTALPAFSPDVMFRRAHLATVGGPLQYVSAWLSQFLFWPALGAGVLAALAAAVAVATDRVGACLAGRRLHGYRYVPALLYLFLDGHYLHLVDWQIGWIVALAAAEAFLRWPEARPVLRLALLLPALAALYYLLGGPLLVALPLLACGETRRRETGVVAPLIVSWQALLPWLSTRAGFDRGLREAYAALLPPVVANDQFGDVPACAWGMVAFAVLLGGLALGAAKSPRRAPCPLFAWAGVAACCVLLPLAAFDPVEGARLAISAHAARGEWPAVLSAADRLGPIHTTQFEGYAILLALAHTRQAGDSLFRYGLQPFSLLRDDPRLGDTIAQLTARAQNGLQLCSLELELGFVNEAEHEIHESLETQGTYARLLVPMARVQVLEGRPEAARVFLRLAAAQPGDPAGAKPLQRALRTDPTLSGDAQQNALARHRLGTDLCAATTAIPLLEEVIKEHPDHRLAWEYLTIWYLLENQLDKLVTTLPSLPRFGREALPRHDEEAVLCYEALNGRQADLGSWRIRAETRQRFDAFIQALGCRDNELAMVLRVPGRFSVSAAPPRLGAWRDTYYYYRLFGTSGAVP